MLYRIAVGAGLFLLGYALGRRVRYPASPKTTISSPVYLPSGIRR